jgi:hypothetical protein
MVDRITRASNVNAHPGMVDRPSQRRSKQEVEKSKKEKAEAKAQTERQKAANIQQVVELESAAKRKMRDMEREANNPVDKMSQPQAKRTRVPEMVNEGTTCHHGIQLTDEALTYNLALKRPQRYYKPAGCQKSEEGGCQFIGSHRSKEW